MATPVLWQIEISHFNEKVRWALDLKGVPHERRAVVPGLQQFRAMREAGVKAQTTPLLQLDGETIVDSSAILAAIEQRWPEPPLFPSDPAERAKALEIEEYFDEDVAHDLRRVVFSDAMEEPDTFLSMMYGPNHPRMSLLKRLRPVLLPVVKQRFAVKPDRVKQSRVKVEAAFDRIATEAGPNGYLVGDSFSLADLTAAAILSPLVVPPQFPYIKLPPDQRSKAARAYRDSLKDHPGFQWALDTYERHRSPSAEVPA